MVRKTKKVFSFILAILMIFTSIQFTMGTNAEAAVPDTFDTATGTLTLNGSFAAGLLKTQIDNVFNTLTPKPTYADIKVLIITAGVVGVGKASDGNDTTGIIPSLTGLVDVQLVGTSTTQSGQNVNTKNTTPTNLFTSVNSKLKSVKLDNVTALSSSTFNSIASLTTLVIPKVTSLSPAAYPNCPNLTSITSGVVVAPPPTGDAVITFDGTNNSKALLDLLADVGYDSTDPAKASLLKTLVIKTSGSSAKKVFANSDFNPTTGKSFSNYKNLTSFTIEKPSDPTFLTWNGNKLPNNAFKGLTSLKTVKIGIDTSYIGTSAFQGDIALETAEFGLTRTLGPLAFSGDNSLKSITFNKTYLPIGLDDLVGPPPAPGDWFYGVDTDHLIIRVPTVSVEIFQSDEDWSSIGDNGVIVMSNGDDAEQDAGSGPAATQIVNINTYFAPKSLKSAIDSSNFTGTNYGDIRVLTINAGILDPADCAFIASNLTKLEELYVVGTANFVDATIPKNAFEGNRYLKKVQADNVTIIGVKAFNLFENLTEVNFPNVTTISSQAFAQTKGSSASKLTTARFPKVKVIEQRAFYFCMNLTNLYLGDVPPVLNVPDGKQGLWFNFVTHMTIHVPSLAVYNEYIKLENSDQIDWSAMTFVADNGDSLPVITPAAPYIDADYNFLRVDHTVPYYNGDYKLSLNMYTFNSNINSFLQGRTSPTPMTALEAIQWAHDHGFDAVDVTCYYIPGYSNTAMPTVDQIPAIHAYAKQIKDLASSLGIAISGTGIQNNFADPNQTRRDLDIERIKFWTQVASEMGAPVIRVFSGPPPVDIARTGWATITHDRIVPAIQQVADYAAANYPDVQIGVQNHGDMLATANQVLQLVQWIDRSNVGIVNDTGYYRDFLNVDASQYDWYKDISLVLPYSNNFQVKKKPGGAETTELMDLKKLFEVIRNSPYRGYIPVELLWLPGDDGYPNNLSTPPYDETSRFLQSMKTAMAETKHVATPDLGGIHLSSGALNETFAPTLLSYTQRVANNVQSLTLTPTIVDAEASVKVNGVNVQSDQPSATIALNVGENIITLVVTAANSSQKTYTVTVTRAPANDGVGVVQLTGPVSVLAGQPLSLTYSMVNVTTSVYAQDLTVNFDPRQLQFVSAKSLVSGFSVAGESDDTGAVRLLLAAEGPNGTVTGTMDVLQLNFKAQQISQTVNSNVYLSNILFGDVNGNVTPLTSISDVNVQITVPVVDKSVLNAKISAAQTTASNAKIGTKWGYHPQSALDTLRAAISSASTVASDGNTTQAQANQAVLDLGAALVTFAGAVNMTASVGDLALLAANYGATSDRSDWALLQMYDFNHDNLLDIVDLAAMARKILGK